MHTRARKARRCKAGQGRASGRVGSSDGKLVTRNGRITHPLASSRWFCARVGLGSDRCIESSSARLDMLLTTQDGLFCFGMTTCESQARFEQICEHSFSSVTACQVSYQAAPKGSNDGHRPSTQHRHHHTRSQGTQRACTLPSPEEHVSNVESADFLLSNRAPCTSRSWTNWLHCTTPG